VYWFVSFFHDSMYVDPHILDKLNIDDFIQSLIASVEIQIRSSLLDNDVVRACRVDFVGGHVVYLQCFFGIKVEVG
jgi:hypothetical protein